MIAPRTPKPKKGRAVHATLSHMHDNEKLITTFYQAFSNRDFATMAACYGPKARFTDPVFRDLDRLEVSAMWHMLCDQGSDLAIAFSDVSADDRTGAAHWEPSYSFGAKSRSVHNTIDATFTFEDGKIVEHIDTFDLWRWSRMALGLPGVLTGWSGPTKTRIQKTANASLRRFIDAHPEYQSK